MKRFEKLLMTLVFIGFASLYGCGEKRSESSVEGEKPVVSDSPEMLASPIRTAEGKIGDTEIKVQYGSPSVKSRVIWGDLLPYDEVWRTGANESTFVEFSSDVTVEGKPLKAGKYSLFTIPKEQGPWTVIFNSEWDLEHGHFQYREENDVLRVESKPRREQNNQESLIISIEENGLLIKWEKLSLPIEIK